MRALLCTSMLLYNCGMNGQEKSSDFFFSDFFFPQILFVTMFKLSHTQCYGDALSVTLDLKGETEISTCQMLPFFLFYCLLLRS